MARWLRDADTGELFREDELDPNSYDPISDWKPAVQARQYEYPEWLTSGATSIPAKALASAAGGGAALERLFGDLAANIPGLEDNALQRDAEVNKKYIDDLLAQTREDNNQTPGSFRDIATSAAGAAIPSLLTLGGGLLLNAGKGALAVAPAIAPSAEKYSALRDRGVSGLEAGKAAAESLALNSLLNRFDVAAAFNPVSTGRRIAQAGAVGAGTNMAGAYGDALLDKSAGAPQTKDEFISNLLTSGATGGLMGTGFAAMASPRVNAETTAPDGQAATDMLARMEQDVPQPLTDGIDPQASAQAFNEYANDQFQALRVPPAFDGGNTLVPDSMVPLVKSKPSPIVDPLADIQPAKSPLIQVEDATSARTPIEQDQARMILDMYAPLSAENARQRNLEDTFLPRGTELEGMRESLPEGTLGPTELQKDKIVRPITNKGTINQKLHPDEQNIVSSVLEAQKRQRVLSKVEEDIAKREELRSLGRKNYVGKSDAELTLRVPSESESFPDPLILTDAQKPSTEALVLPDQQPQPVEAPSIITEEGYNARTPDQIAEAQEFRRQVEMIGLQPREQMALFSENEVASIKPEDTSSEALPKALKKRAVKRLGKYERSAERGDTLLASDLLSLARWTGGKLGELRTKASTNPALSDYQDWSKTNKRYDDGTWGRVVEWMDTTAKKEPAAAPFIEAQWKIPQDTSAIVWDADATLAPYKQSDLTPSEKAAANSYLQAARVLGSRDRGYKVSPETAVNAGLNAKQTQAVLAVKNWSNFFADIFENEALAQAEHNAKIAELKAPPSPEYKATIAQTLQDSRNKIADTFAEWRKANYVPFDRYGEHFINVYNPNGELIARQQFDSPKDPAFLKARQHYEELAKQPGEFLGAKVQYGRQKPSSLVQFDGVSQDILDMLGNDASGDPITGFSRHLKNAKLIQGQNLDLDRAISQYTVGASRLIAFRRASRAAEMELATNLRGDDKINLRNKLQEWQASLNTKTSGVFKAINEAFNFAYIGGNARTPTADVIGALQMQPLVLSKYLNGLQPEAVGLKTIGNLAKWYAGKGIDPRLAAGIKEAQRKNIIPDDTLKNYIRKGAGSDGPMEGLVRAKDAYFILKSTSERFVDAGAFMSGWEAWNRLPAEKRNGISQQQFAENLVREMRAVPSQMELPANRLTKSETGRLITKYRWYQAKILKTLAETPLSGKIRYLVGVGMTTGLMGLPFIGREFFSAARAGGYEPEDKLREMGAGSAFMYGPLSEATGIDFSGTAGFGDVFSTQSSNPFTKLALGIAGAPFESIQRAYQFYDRGQPDRAVASLPISNLLSNYLTQSDWGDRGVVTMGGKAVIPREEVSGIDRIKKLLGYQPLAVKEAMVLENRKKQAASEAVDNDHINQRIGEAEGLGDYQTADALRQIAIEKGLRINKQSVRRYRDLIQGRDKKYPKAARELIAQLQETYGQ